MIKKAFRFLSLTIALIMVLGSSALAADMTQVTFDREESVSAEAAVLANIVNVNGASVDQKAGLILSFIVKAGDNIISVGQGKTDENGEFKKTITLDTDLYDVGATPTAMLMVSGRKVNTVVLEIPLYSAEDIKGVIPAVCGISNMEKYVEVMSDYGDILSLKALTEAPLAEYYEAQYELFETQKPSDISDLGELSQWAVEYEKSVQRVYELMDAVNKASAAKKWGTIEKLVTDTYADLLDIDKSKADDVNNKAMFMRMCKTVYSTRNEIEEAYDSAYTTQKNAEKNSSSSGGGGGGSSSGGGVSFAGGGGFAASSNKVNNTTDKTDSIASEGEQKVQTTAPAFTDVGNVLWAAEAIDELRTRGIVSGDGQGGFEPERQVAREELLSMLMNTFRLPDAANNGGFTDVAENDWCYGIVSQAHGLGLVNGMPDGSFGKGQPVTRADLAVMVVRLVNLIGKDLKLSKPAIVFSDYYLIPDYAEQMISVLQQAGIVNGDDNGCFNPLGGATRAETAVVVYNLIKVIEGGE